MATSDSPTNTYNSFTDLSIGQVPQVDDPVLYRALLDIHNALETLLTSSDNGNLELVAFLTKFRNTTSISSDYQVLSTDGTIEVDASSNDVTVTLPLISEIPGYRFEIKVLAKDPAYSVTVVGRAGELIDDKAAGIGLSLLDSLVVKNNQFTSLWNIL